MIKLPVPAGVRLAAGALLLAVLSGCATGPNANPRDPLEPLNRNVDAFNQAVDNAVLKPVATAYKNVTPAPVRTGVSNFFGNLGDLWSAVNSVLQLKPQGAAENIMRFSFNTVFGFAGVLDIASEIGIERHKEDFGQTLGRWGVPAGPYLVIPFLGPSTVRDASALTVDVNGDLVRHIDNTRVRNQLWTLRLVETRANLLRASSVLDEAALDKYSFTRDAYLQYRRADVYDEGGDTGGALVKPRGKDAPKPQDDENDGKIPKLEEPAPAAAPRPATR
ncbi:MAG: VacJ family lipoprotein [Burkholderiaceae bacterium]